MMNDPNNSVMLLAIIQIPDFKNSALNSESVIFYEEDIYNSSFWISKHRKDNLTGVDCVPTINTLVTFNDNPDLFTFVTTQPKSYLTDKELSKELQHQITDNICVLLSLKEEDDSDSFATLCLDQFKKSGFNYAMCETHIVYDIVDGCIDPTVVYSPFWVEKKIENKK